MVHTSLPQTGSSHNRFSRFCTAHRDHATLQHVKQQVYAMFSKIAEVVSIPYPLVTNPSIADASDAAEMNEIKNVQI